MALRHLLPLVLCTTVGAYQVNVRITTGDGGQEHSHHSFPITVSSSLTGEEAPLQYVHEPDQGVSTYLVFESSPFPTEKATSVRIDHGGNDGWYIQSVEVMDKNGRWRVWGIEDMDCRKSNWVEGDSNHPSFLEFSRCHEIDVRVRTGGKSNSGSIHTFEVEIMKGSTKIKPFPEIKSPDDYDVEYIRVVSPFPVNEMTELKIDNGGVDGWFVEAVEVQDEYGNWQVWGLPDMKCKQSSWVDYPIPFFGSDPDSLSFGPCSTPVQVIVGQINVRVHTAPGLAAGSIHDFPISALSDVAHDYTLPVDITSPGASGTEYVALDATFKVSELTSIRIEHGGIDGWEVEGLEVEDEFGAWNYWGIQNLNCKKGSPIDGDSSHPKFLEFTKCNELRVMIATNDASADGSADDFEVELHAAAQQADPNQVVSAPRMSGTYFVHATAPFSTTDLTEIQIKQAGMDPWNIKYVSVLDVHGKWQKWGHSAACLEGGETNSDATHATYLSFKNCLTASSTNQINVRITTGNTTNAHTFPLSAYAGGAQAATQVFHTPDKDEEDYITLQSASSTASQITEMRIEQGAIASAWFVNSLEVQDGNGIYQMWGLKDHDCQSGAFVGAAPYDLELVYVPCNTIEVLITTAGVANAGSVHTFAIDLKSASAQANPSPTVAWPATASIHHIRATAPFGKAALKEVVINNGGIDDWEIAEVLVKSDKGLWERWGVTDLDCTDGGAVGSDSYPKLSYSACTVPPVSGQQYDIQVRITTGDSLMAGSSNDFPIAVYDSKGTKSAVTHTHSPSSNEVFYRILKAPFAPADVQKLRIDNGGTNAWFVEMVEVRDENGIWQVYGVEDMGCKKSEWIDKDKAHPSYLEFSKCHDIEVLITTGLLDGAKSIGDFKVELISNTGVKTSPTELVESPDIGQVDHFRSVAPFTVANLAEVRVDHNEGFLPLTFDGWYVYKVQVREADGMWYTWGIIPLGCQVSSWIDEDSAHPKNVTWERCTTPPPPTESPCDPVLQTVFEVDVRITTGGDASAHSHHTFPITLAGGSLKAEVKNVYEPSKNEETYLVFDRSPFPTEKATSVRIDTGGNDGWYIEKVEVKDVDGFWRTWGVEGTCKQSTWVDGNSNHPEYAEFVPCHEINVRVTTGGAKSSGSIHTFDIELKSGSKKITPYPKIRSPDKYDMEHIRVVSPWPVHDLTEVKIDEAGIDGWYVEAVEVMDEYNVWQRWGLPKLKCQKSSWVDYKPFWGSSDPEVLNFGLCTTPPQVIVAQINVRVHTGPGLTGGSINNFPISAISDVKHDYTIPVNVLSPSASSTQYIALDSTFVVSELSAIRIEHGGIDGWAVEGLEVEDENGVWSYWGVKGNCKKSQIIDGQAYDFVKCNEIQVLIVTDINTGDDSAGDYDVELLSASSKADPKSVVSAPGLGSTDYIHAVSTFSVSSLKEVKISDNSGSDNWKIKSVHVLDASNEWQKWGWGASCEMGGETTADSSHPTYLSFTDCKPVQHNFQINLRLKVEDSPSVHQFDITVKSSLGTELVANVDSPVKAGYEYLTIESPFSSNTITEIVVSKGTASWELDSLELENDQMIWNMVGVKSDGCRAGAVLPDAGLTYVPGACQTVEVLIHTGMVTYASSVHVFDIDLKAGGVQLTPSPKIKSPAEGHIEHIRTTAPFGADELTDVIINSSGNDGWHVEKVMVMKGNKEWVQWGVISQDCTYASFVDGNGAHKVLDYKFCVPPPVTGKTYQIEFRITSGNQFLAGSDHDFPIVISDKNGVKSSTAKAHTPDGGEVFWRVVTAPFPASHAETLRIDNGGSNAWYIEKVEVLDEDHRWQIFGIADMNCKMGEWVDKDKAHPSYLEYSRCNDIEVIISTGLLQDADSVGDFEIELISKSGAKFPTKGTVSSPGIGEVWHWKAVGPFSVDDLEEVRIDHNDHWTNILKWDGWYVAHVHVWDGSKWTRWGVADQDCSDNSWIDGDSALPKDISFTKCKAVEETKPPCTETPETLVPGWTAIPTDAPLVNTTEPETEAPDMNTTAPDTTVPDTTVPETEAPDTNTTAPDDTEVPTDAPDTNTTAPDTLIPDTLVPGDTDVPATDAPATVMPTMVPTDAPTAAPTGAPATDAPATTDAPTLAPGDTMVPTTDAPATGTPTMVPTDVPTTDAPATGMPTDAPTLAPGDTTAPATDAPTQVPSQTAAPTGAPATGAPATTDAPTLAPGDTMVPVTNAPATGTPTGAPTLAPGNTMVPTLAPGSVVVNTEAPDTVVPTTAPGTTSTTSPVSSTTDPSTLAPGNTNVPTTNAPATGASTGAPTLAPGNTMAPTLAPGSVVVNTEAPATDAPASTDVPTLAPGTTAMPTTTTDAPAKQSDECAERSGAVMCSHKPRYTASGCLCQCDWTAVFKDLTGKVITMPPGPGSSEPCTDGCCNPDSNAGGDWCYLSPSDYNIKKGCVARKEVCAVAGTLPSDGGVTRAPVPGIPDNQNNVCTDVGQICEDPDLTTPNDWICKCAPPMVGTAPQKPATCVSAPTTGTPDTLSPGATSVPTFVPTDAPATNAPDTLAPGNTYAPATTAPDTLVPTDAPATEVPETLAPGNTYAPATTAPDTVVPTNAPATEVPETLAPGNTYAPATTAPDTLVPTDAPATEVPETLAPGNTYAPATTAPDTLVPTDAPATNVPDTLAPGNTYAPATTAPDTLVPTDAPATNAPDTLAPGNTYAPATSAPFTLAPTNAPATDAPATLTPETTGAPVIACPDHASYVVCATDKHCQWDTASSECIHKCPVYDSQPTCDGKTNCQWDTSKTTCVDKCPAYTSQPICDSASNCLWDAANTQCIEKCPSYGSQPTCDAAGNCQWDASKTECVDKCPSHTSQPTCDTTGSCQWDSSKTQCVDKCPAYKAAQTCDVTTNCQWDTTASECVDKTPCTSYGTDAVNCVATSYCMMEPTTAGAASRCVDKPVCSSLIKANCDSTASCEWDSTEKCVEKCSAHDGRPVTCGKTDRCQYLTATSTCVDKCPTHMTSQVCGGAAHCQWDTANTKCVDKCPAHMEEKVCNDATSCEWDATNTCVDKRPCTGYIAQPTCTGDDNCEWDATNTQCVDKCPTLSTATTCNGATNCLWNSATTECINKCPAYSTQPTCDGTDYCQWDSTKTACIDKPPCTGYGAQPVCNAAASCKWDTETVGCVDKCPSITSQPTCDDSTICKWDATKLQCVDTCPSHGTQDVCDTALNCKWESSKCVDKPPCTGYGAQPTCDAKAECQWDSEKKTCVDTCPMFSAQPSCDDATACKWDSTTTQCVDECPAHKMQPSCEGTKNCDWDSTKSECVDKPPCTGFGAQPTCDSASQCKWNSQQKQCLEKCESHGMQAVCDAASNCQWDFTSTTCVDKCPTHTAQPACDASSVCKWDAASDKCVDTCPSHIAQTTCDAADCQWDAANTVCVDKCSAHTAELTCYASKICQWDTAKKTCIENPPCSSLVEMPCTSTASCQWDATKTVCTDKLPCIGFGSEATCDTTSCEWDADSTRCVDKCSAQGAQPICDSALHCVWDTDKSECGDKRSCAGFKTKTTCNPNADCQWDTTQSVCVDKAPCPGYSAQQTCDGSLNCQWDKAGTQCIDKCSPLAQVVCDVTAHCLWDANQCIDKPPCGHSTQILCTDDTNCQWDAATPKCVEKPDCSFTMETTCNGAANCEWDVSKACIPTSPCKAYNGQPVCDGDWSCQWDSTASECTARPDCGGHNVEAQCEGDSNCAWDATSKCTDKDCTTYNIQVACQANNYCQWESDVCIEKPERVRRTLAPGQLSFAPPSSAPATELPEGATWNPALNTPLPEGETYAPWFTARGAGSYKDDDDDDAFPWWILLLVGLLLLCCLLLAFVCGPHFIPPLFPFQFVVSTPFSLPTLIFTPHHSCSTVSARTRRLTKRSTRRSLTTLRWTSLPCLRRSRLR